MEGEVFEDIEAARAINDAFVSIKVDREERPDIDSIYMLVAQIMNHSGGWPLNIIMTPSRRNRSSQVLILENILRPGVSA